MRPVDHACGRYCAGWPTSLPASLYLCGEYVALRVLFGVRLCAGPDDCRWILTGWHPVAIGALFLFAYLPLSPIVSVFCAWPGYLLCAILYWIPAAGARGAVVWEDSGWTGQGERCRIAAQSMS